MRFPAFASVLCAVALAAPLAAAEDLVVSGDDVAGSVAIEGARLTLELTRFRHRSSSRQTIEGEVIARDSGGLRWSYTVREVERLGLVHPLLPTVRPTIAEREVEVDMAYDRERDAWTGEVAGLPQTWSRQAAPDDLVVLVVPGLSTNLWNQYGVPYLDENLATIRARGLEARRLAINTEAAVATNAAGIAAEVRREVARGKRVVLVAHSKGGADAITALTDPANRDLLPRVAAFAAIQPVYAGSPIADLVGSSSLIQGSVDAFFERVLPAVNRVDDEGEREAVRDLRSETRQALLARHPFVVDGEPLVPTVVVRGSFSGRPLFRFRHVLRKPLFVFQDYLQRFQGVESDGMVALEWQRIPGAAAEVTLDDIDHFEPGFRGESPHTPAKITHLILDRVLPLVAADAVRAVPLRPGTPPPGRLDGGRVDLPLGG